MNSSLNSVLTVMNAIHDIEFDYVLQVFVEFGGGSARWLRLDFRAWRQLCNIRMAV